MLVDVAIYHSGDGDGRDPLDPSRIPTSCEIGNIIYKKIIN